jgi:hypothetical protein
MPENACRQLSFAPVTNGALYHRRAMYGAVQLALARGRGGKVLVALLKTPTRRAHGRKHLLILDGLDMARADWGRCADRVSRTSGSSRRGRAPDALSGCRLQPISKATQDEIEAFREDAR